MGSPLIKRLDALYQRAQMVMKVQADHAPFLYVAPWSFMKNECRVKYFPEGTYQEEEKITTTFHNATCNSSSITMNVAFMFNSQ